MLPGFQHARDGFHVIYELGERKNGLDQFTWRMKHPQGQIESAHVDIQIRSTNKPPVALNGTTTLVEDSVKEITLRGSDVDDSIRPAFYVTNAPVNGFLYQCAPVTGSGRCGLGEKISRLNETMLQWAAVEVDPDGALDGSLVQIYKVSEPLGSTEISKVCLGVCVSAWMRVWCIFQRVCVCCPISLFLSRQRRACTSLCVSVSLCMCVEHVRVRICAGAMRARMRVHTCLRAKP